MPTESLKERALRIREKAGYGGNRRASDFAKALGIKAPSLHAIESGKTRSLRQETIDAYLRIGANIDYLLKGKGEPMLRKIEKDLNVQTVMSMLDEVDEGTVAMVMDVLKGAIRRQQGSSVNDPFKKDPPKDKDK